MINSLFHPDKKGGVETVVQTIANEFKKQKHEVVVICAGKEKNKTIEEKLSGFKIYRIGWSQYFAFQNIDQQNTMLRFLWRIHQLNNKYSAKIIKAILNKENPDLILSHNTLGLGYNVIKKINTLNIKHILTIHDVQLIIPSGKLLIGQKINKLFKIYSFFTKNIFKNCKYIISPSDILLKFYTRQNFFPKAETKILFNPINLNIKIKSETKIQEEFKILYLGQLEEHKGVMELIKAFRLLDQEKFSLTIAGRGFLGQKIKNMEHVISNMNFFGEYNNEQRIELLKKHHIIVVPSKCFENAPMVVLEAWQQGVPVLASNFGGLPELIEENKNGWLFNPENIQNLKNKIEEIYKNRTRLNQISKYCLENVKRYNIENYVKTLTKF